MSAKQIKKTLAELSSRAELAAVEPGRITVVLNGGTAAEMIRLEKRLAARGLAAVVLA